MAEGSYRFSDRVDRLAQDKNKKKLLFQEAPCLEEDAINSSEVNVDLNMSSSSKRFSVRVTLLGTFAESRKATISSVMSFRPHGTTGLPLDQFS